MELNKVLRHPDKEEIIKMLVNGSSVKQVDAWLKKKYPKAKRNHISFITLQKFRTEHLNIKGDLLEDIRAKKKSDEANALQVESKLIVANSADYQKKINEIVSNEMDVSRKLLEMETLISSRLEFYYNQLSSGKTVNTNYDKVFIEYISMLRSIMQDWKKYVEGFADKKIEHNLNVNVVNDQLKIMKEVVIDVLKDMDPSLVLVFMEKLNKRMTTIQYDSPEYNQYIIEVDDE